MKYVGQIEALFDAAYLPISDILPSEWNEKHRIMTTDVSPRAGKFSYEYTPYLREVIDCLSPTNPAKIVGIMKGAQVGFSTGVIEGGVGWIISENPGNILFLTGHADLADEAVTGKIDNLIDNSGIRPLIKANTNRARNTRSGDTNKKKEFAGGSFIAGGVGNHKLHRQRSMRYGFIDDFDAAKSHDKSSGSTRKMIEQRFAAYNSTKKIFYISTPELALTSNIEPVYLMGDQRKFHTPCPCCGEFIIWDWVMPIEGTEKEKGGITWKVDEFGHLIKESVGYICYKCGGFYDDRNKTELLALGEWIPTAKPISPDYRSYHLSALYAPIGMDDWAHYVQSYLSATDKNNKDADEELKTFWNLCLGKTWEDQGEAPKASQLQKNTRGYKPKEVPEKLSIRDGNGKIILLTLAVDLNGKTDDARADYEIVAWAESGASYSILQGSIGTFIPNEKEENTERDKWTYEHGRSNSVWPEIDKLIATKWEKDTGKTVRISIAGVDAPSHWAQQAYGYADSVKIFALKGKDTEDKITRLGVDAPIVKPSRNKKGLYLVEVNLVKDELARLMRLEHDFKSEEKQPIGYMNFPTPHDGAYTYQKYFKQFESEHRTVARDSKGTPTGMIWAKKTSAHQNHFWDCRVYNIALKQMWIDIIGKELNVNDFTWVDYAELVTAKK